MKILTIALVLLASASAFSQKTFDIKNASKYFDISVRVEKCEDSVCSGETAFSFFKKGGAKPYQVIMLDDTYMDISNDGKPLVNTTMLYDEQSVISVDDYNFDGMEDVALCNGQNGSYGMPSYDVYLSSRKQGKFVHSKAFSDLGAHLGLFSVVKNKKQLETFDKSGCCWHITERYDVVGNKPRKVFEMVEDATIPDEAKVKVTTKTLVNGKWKKSVKYEKREE
ncbi:MAG: hypothetical protein IPL32_05350 [Chloracidobacterium sp.]|nr:hypothetical protein [Chloracidobacterium sp.]